MFDEGIKDNVQNGLNNLRLQTIEYIQQRNRWIDKEKEIINNTSFALAYKIKAVDFISDFYSEIIDTNIKADYSLEQNYVDYYSTIALGTKNLGDYNPSEDYTKVKMLLKN